MADRIAPRLLGFSFYWAWTLLCFQSTVAFLPSGYPADGLAGIPAGMLADHAGFFTCSLVCTVLAHPLWAWVIHRFPASRTRTPWACAAIQTVSILYVGLFAGDPVAALEGPLSETDVPVLLAAAASGITSAFMDVRWSQVYGMQRPDVSGRCIALSIALGIVLYFAVGSLGRLSPALCIAAIAALPPLCAWSLGRNARCEAEEPTVPPLHNARQIAGVLWRPVVGSLMFFFVYGCIESIVVGRVDFNDGQAAALGVGLVVALALLGCLRRRSRLSVSGTYGVALVLVSAGFMVLPMAMQVTGAGGSSGGLFAVMVLVGAGTSLFDMLLYCMIAHAAYDYRTPGGVVNGVVRFVTVGFSAVGHIAGQRLGEGFWSGTADMVLFVIAVTYLLIVSASFFLARRRLAALPGDGDEAPVRMAEVLASDPAPAAGVGDAPAGVRDAAAGGRPGVGDAAGARDAAADAAGNQGAPAAPGTPADELEALLDRRIGEIAFAKHLSRRETDVFALVARGRSVPYVAETLVLSENTVRSHVRRIYNKLGVHSKQELLDLVEGGGTEEAQGAGSAG